MLRTSEKAAAISAAPTNQPTQADLMRQAGMPVDPDELRALLGDFGGLSGDLLDGIRSKVDNRTPINFTPDGKQLSVVGSTTVWIRSRECRALVARRPVQPVHHCR